MRSIYDGSTPSFHGAKKPEHPATQTNDPQDKEVQAKKAETPVGESKKEVKQEAPKSPTPQNSPSPSSNINHVLKEDKSINKLLKKASDIDQVNHAEDPSSDTSGWELADDEPAPIKIEPVVNPTKTKKEDSFKAEPPKETKPEPVSIATDKGQEQKLPQKEKSPEKAKSCDEENCPAPSSSTRETTTVVTTSNREDSSTAKASPKSLGLKQSVEKLSTLVLQLEDVIDKLIKANLDKDERLLKLEQKVSELSK